MNVTINILELASELASIELENSWQESVQIYEDEEAECLTYTEEAQEIFNGLYDHYYAMIENCKVHS